MKELNIAFAQLNNIVGDVEHNLNKAIDTIKEAEQQDVDLLLFPELYLSGYLAKDLFFKPSLTEACEVAINKLCELNSKVAIVIGSPSKNQKRGKRIFNSAYFIKEGRVENIYNKWLLPDYDIFNERRYFEPGSENQIVELKGKKLALTICEDIWYPDSIHYQHYPLSDLETNYDAIINIAASPFARKQHIKREETLRSIWKKFAKPVYYCNQVGAHTEVIFDGCSAIYNEHGWRKIAFKEGLILGNDLEEPSFNEIERVRQALVTGIKDFYNKQGFKSAVIGLSGGIDSAVVAALLAEALGGENLHCVLLPSQYSSDHSVSDSEKLVKNLACHSEIIPIEESFQAALNSLSKNFEGTEFGLAEENLQARIRGTLLMAISNKHGHLLINTSNKSESAVGYGTLYGDMCGALSVIGDLYKQEVYELARNINSEKEIIPENIITKAPSAELRPDQKDSDSLPDYDILDGILQGYIDEFKSEEDLIKEGYDAATVKRITQLVNRNEYKRFQMPPVLRVSHKAFGFGRQIPLVAKLDI